MPDMSTIKTFVKALKTGMTKTTKALDKCDYASHLDELRKPHALDKPLPGWARGALQPPLSDAELDHIDDWPDGQKDLVREAIVTAAENKRKLQFFWELHSGTDEETDIQGLAGAGTTTIRFRSPRSKLRVSMATFGDISVNVGP